MCNGTSSRTSQGGRIVVLQPIQTNNSTTTTTPRLNRELSLRLDDDSTLKKTTVTIDGVLETQGGGQLIIHRDGDLSCSSAAEGETLDSSSILHRFDLPARLGDQRFTLASRFDLGVGGEGIVGRRVSLIRDQLLVGQGIVGWN